MREREAFLVSMIKPLLFTIKHKVVENVLCVTLQPKVALSILWVTLTLSSALAEVTMTRVNPSLFIHKPLTDFDEVVIADANLLREKVKAVFDADLINHKGSKGYEGTTADFELYYSHFARSWRLVDMNNDGNPELIFNGLITAEDDREYLEVYAFEKGKPEQLFNTVGHLLAYLIQPNTKEVLLFHHQYPCCINASHNLNRLRLVKGKIQQIKRYFLGRDSGMKGKFFPDKVSFTGKYRHTSETVELRWSGSIINKDAWFQRSPSNVVAHFEAPVTYKILAQENGWYFVLMHSPPIQEKNSVINPANFAETAIYGWMESRSLRVIP